MDVCRGSGGDARPLGVFLVPAVVRVVRALGDRKRDDLAGNADTLTCHTGHAGTILLFQQERTSGQSQPLAVELRVVPQMADSAGRVPCHNSILDPARRLPARLRPPAAEATAFERVSEVRLRPDGERVGHLPGVRDGDRRGVPSLGRRGGGGNHRPMFQSEQAGRPRAWTTANVCHSETNKDDKPQAEHGIPADARGWEGACFKGCEV